MKRLFYFLAFSLAFLSTNIYAQKSATIIKADKAPVIDGVKDAVWSTYPAVAIDALSNKGDGTASVSATWRASWDDTNLYLLFEVKDDVVMNTGKSDGSIPWYLHDCMEVFTDMNNKKNDAAVTNSEGQYQLRFIYGMDKDPMYENPKMTGYQTISKKTTDGYIIEISFPWSLLTDKMTKPVKIAEGLELGLDFKVTDMDKANPTNDWWPAHYEYVWNSAKDKKAINFGTVKLAAYPAKKVTVMSTGSSPSIDGTVDAIWNNAEVNTISNLSNAGTGNPSVSGSWKALWDNTNLYMLFDVKDDIRINAGAGNPIWYLHDCMEIFTDMNNKKNDAAVTNSDGQYQLRFIYGLDKEPIYENPKMTGFQTISKDNAAGDGYVIEVKFPWSLLTANMTNPIKIAEGLEMGIDFKLTDIDVVVPNDWWPSHFEYAWNNAGGKKAINFGSIVLQKTPDTEKPTAPANLKASLKDLSATLNWEASKDNEGVNGYNIKANGAILASVGANELTKVIALKAGNEYKLTITAIDAAGNESAPSNEAVVKTEGLAPMPEGTPIAKASAAITIDGKSTETDWNTARYLMARVDTWEPNPDIQSDADFSASYKALWDDKILYLLFEVNDELATQGIGDWWVQDCIEILIPDGDKNYKYRFVYGLDNQVKLGGEEIEVPAGFKNVSVKTSKGYIIEASIPWSSFKSVTEVKRAAQFGITFTAYDIDKADASTWTDISGILGWPMGKLVNKFALGNADDVTIDGTAPTAPKNVKGTTEGFQTINASWDASADKDVVSYTVKVNGKTFASVTDASIKLENLKPETSYEISIVANDGQNFSTLSNVAKVSTPAKPVFTAPMIKIGKTDVDPTIDFMVWNDFPSYPIRNPEKTYDAKDLSATWKAVWDDKNFYIQVTVKDADIYNLSGNAWENDNVEFHFDMNNERNGTSCENVQEKWEEDNVQYRAIINSPTLQTGSSNKPVWENVQMAFYPVTEGGVQTGYQVEMVYPWESLTTKKSDKIKFTPKIASQMGFELQVSDKDPFVNDKGETVYNNADANGVMWWSEADVNITPAFNNEQYGIIELSEKPAIGISHVRRGNLNVYPNPVSDKLNIKLPSDHYETLLITDLTGRTVFSKSINQLSGEMTIDVKSFASGSYIISVYNQNEVLRSKITIK